ncbi:hypothetical protein LY78DRAFT_649950 [Colletotrichum sublineola]|nr:hypothetical protein LY78DRAFT_649950 [Colletotrichum sublineola]
MTRQSKSVDVDMDARSSPTMSHAWLRYYSNTAIPTRAHTHTHTPREKERVREITRATDRLCSASRIAS